MTFPRMALLHSPARHKNVRKVRVLAYLGDNTFRVLTSDDATVMVRRERLTFIR